MKKDYSRILKILRPNSQYKIINQKIIWKDTENELPTESEMDACHQEIVDTIEPNRILREERDFALKQTDVFLLEDFPLSTSEKKEIMKYRKQLRDLPKTFEKKPKEVVFPDPPAFAKLKKLNP